MNSKNLGIRIKEQRKKKMLSQKELASNIGISIPALSNFENGSKSPSVETLINLSKALNTTPNNLLKDYIEVNENSPNNEDLYYYKYVIDSLSDWKNYEIKDIAGILSLLNKLPKK